ncbi:MAG: hypothetical protein GY715_11660 [Planctomycetes bacterium]|nr:hypothetical protein [Planctomycetota bacterium]
MNPNEHKSLAQQGDNPADEDNSLSTFSDGSFGESGHDPLAGAMSSRKSHTGSILVVAVILVAVAGVFSMRKLAEVTAATGFDKEIEATIEQFLGTLTPTGQRKNPDTDLPLTDRDEILAVLGTAYTEIQVPLRDVQRDPFIISELESPQIDPVDLDPEDLSAQQERRWRELQDARRAELLKGAESFKLKAIMGGSKPLAIINDQTVTKGATIVSANGEEFKVLSIGSATVELLGGAAELDIEVPVTLVIKRDR